jgi:diguanylate cyclase (GGDEF)-like protein
VTSALDSDRLRSILVVARALAQIDDEDRLLELIASAARESLGYKVCVVAVRDEVGRLVHRFGSGCSEELLEELRQRPWSPAVWTALREAATPIGSILWVPPDHPVRQRPEVAEAIVPTPVSAPSGSWRRGSLLFVPMVDFQGQVIGLISMDDPSSGELPTLPEASLLETFAYLAAAALQLLRGRTDTRRLERRAEDEQRRLRHLLQAMSSVRSSLDLDTVLAGIAAGVRAATGFGRAAIYLYDQPSGLLQVRATTGLSAEEDQRLRSTPVPLSDFAPMMQPEMLVSRSYLFDHRHFTLPQELNELLSVPERDPASWQDGEWHPVDSLTVPLTSSDGELLGIISADEPDTGRLPGVEEVQRLELFADECSAAVAQARLHQAVRNQAERDPLTDLPNRRALVRTLAMELESASFTGAACSVLFCDVDHFKKINDAHGHVLGDDVLKAVAGALSGRVRADDTVARFGGEEFVIVLPHTDSRGAMRIAEDLRAAVERIDRFGFNVRISIGVAASDKDSRLEAEALLAQADRALYEAKRAGRNRVRLAGGRPAS